VVERCARGVLRFCNHLRVKAVPFDVGSRVCEAALRALGRCWRPDPSLVDGSSPFVRGQGNADRSQLGTGGWSLTLCQVPPFGRALEALPEGLTYLKLR
jgi:hypothetical protein